MTGFEHFVDRIEPLPNSSCFQHGLGSLVRRNSCNGRLLLDFNNVVKPVANLALHIGRFL
ncbi:hypothetical protein CLU80_3022 [Pseudomonas sp. 29]|uniref:Uncharacterized protein n=1 Tax=Pseudomonas fluorescens TaxID=294 RepID=A0A5E7KBT1_PSEFL|nr:hypothetical protein [Pseudomonas fluorescens]PIF50645.1 hypothetical protein CLU80_3022 [Pseudomonas sp. 29]SEN17501.1 hypothetical protein SAMN04487856_10245 [Pseudomonas sp. ok266]VVO99229.1 hypothetical protein PS896_02734 [Pseudomonas fluorescens]